MGHFKRIRDRRLAKREKFEHVAVVSHAGFLQRLFEVVFGEKDVEFQNAQTVEIPMKKLLEFNQN